MKCRWKRGWRFDYLVDVFTRLDAHMAPIQFPASKVGDTFEGHVRIFAWDSAKVAAALQSAAPPRMTRPNPERIAHIEPVNRCDRIAPGMTGESWGFWIGNYEVDRSTGHGDRACMKIDAAWIKDRTSTDAKGDDRPSIILGPSFRTGPYPAKKYRFAMLVKADGFKGKVTLRADGFVHPKGTKLPPALAELAINGRCDWTPMSFEADWPRKLYAWMLRIDAEGEGTILVDDLELSPVDGN